MSNTSPLTNLAAIGRFHLLRDLYGHLYIPQAVWDELNASGNVWPGREEVASANWITRREVRDATAVAILRQNLDAGEAETIMLALELGADLVLLDEREGRHTAQWLGLHVVGVVGVLIEAKSRGLVDRVQPLLDELRYRAGFYLSDAVYRMALRLAEEAS